MLEKAKRRSVSIISSHFKFIWVAAPPPICFFHRALFFRLFVVACVPMSREPSCWCQSCDSNLTDFTGPHYLEFLGIQHRFFTDSSRLENDSISGFQVIFGDPRRRDVTFPRRLNQAVGNVMRPYRPCSRIFTFVGA